MEFKSYINDITKQLMKKLQCIVAINEKENYYRVNIKGIKDKERYYVEFFMVDSVGTLGVRIQWIVGKVVDYNEVCKCLILNGTKFLKYGVLFAAILPNDRDNLFALVGQMVFPAFTEPEEIVTILYNNAMLNYWFGDMLEFPGVELF